MCNFFKKNWKLEFENKVFVFFFKKNLGTMEPGIQKQFPYVLESEFLAPKLHEALLLKNIGKHNLKFQKKTEKKNTHEH